jgi:hypothetical protein
MSTEADYAYDVFISYSHHDEAWVTGTLLPRLEEAGLHVCIDLRDFIAGKPALVNMQDAVKHSRHTLLVLTPAWVESEWTFYESLLTRTKDPAGLQRRTVPLRLQSCEIPEFISMLTWVDFTRPDWLKVAWTQLLTALGAPPVQQAPPIPAPKKTSKQSPETKASTRDARTRDLLHKLMDRCSLGDLKDLCFVMSIDYDNYPGGKSDFIRDLLKDLQQQGRLDEFERTLRQEKPWVLR